VSRRIRLFAVLVPIAALAVLLPACGGDDGGGSETAAQDPADLEGKDWVVTQILDASGDTQIVEFGISAAFDGSSITGVVACNSYNAGYEATGNEISFGEIATTMALCPPDEQAVADRYLELLAGAATYAVEGRSMSMSDAQGTPVIQFSQG
jgi:heat shock protein HslJ